MITSLLTLTALVLSSTDAHAVPPPSSTPAPVPTLASAWKSGDLPTGDPRETWSKEDCDLSVVHNGTTATACSHVGLEWADSADEHDDGDVGHAHCATDSFTWNPHKWECTSRSDLASDNAESTRRQVGALWAAVRAGEEKDEEQDVDIGQLYTFVAEMAEEIGATVELDDDGKIVSITHENTRIDMTELLAGYAGVEIGLSVNADGTINDDNTHIDRLSEDVDDLEDLSDYLYILAASNAMELGVVVMDEDGQIVTDDQGRIVADHLNMTSRIDWIENWLGDELRTSAWLGGGYEHVSGGNLLGPSGAYMLSTKYVSLVGAGSLGLGGEGTLTLGGGAEILFGDYGDLGFGPTYRYQTVGKNVWDGSGSASQELVGSIYGVAGRVRLGDHVGLSGYIGAHVASRIEQGQGRTESGVTNPAGGINLSWIIGERVFTPFVNKRAPATSQ